MKTTRYRVSQRERDVLDKEGVKFIVLKRSFRGRLSARNIRLRSMKTFVIFFTTIVGLMLPALALAQDKEMRADIEKDIPLVEAIRRVNEQYPDVQPLTEQEVVAAVQAIKLQHPDIKEAIYKIYQRVAKEKVLPRGMYFSRIPGWHTQYGHFEVDWKDLTLTSLPVGTKDEKIGSGYNYRIRARFISSRPLTESEQKAMKERTWDFGSPIRIGEVGRNLTGREVLEIERLVSTNGGKPWLLIGQSGQFAGFQLVQVYCQPTVSSRELRRGPLAFISRQSDSKEELVATLIASMEIKISIDRFD
jgi:hypothetical protein